jgi:alpha/beta superfamily hydrolase
MHPIRKSILTILSLVILCPMARDLSGQAVIGATEVGFMSGGNLLRGRFFPADASRPSPTVLLLPDLPGFDVTETSALGLEGELSRIGVNVLTFNYRGTHASDGFFTLAGVDQDIDAARRWLHSPDTAGRFAVDPDEIIVGGFGFGGGMAMAYSSTDLSITEVFSVAGFDLTVAMNRYVSDPIYAEVLETRLTSSESDDDPVRWERGDFFAFIKEAMQGSGRWDLGFAAPQLARKRLLLVGALDDTEAPIEDHLLPFYRVLSGLGTRDLEFAVYQDNHSFLNVHERLAEMVITWIRDGMEE